MAFGFSARETQTDIIRMHGPQPASCGNIASRVGGKSSEGWRAERVEPRAAHGQEPDEAARLKVAEKDQTIESMSRTIEELKRKAAQGSQQAQGEALEADLEEMLRARFPMDASSRSQGELGADVVHRVNATIGSPAGIILWELKRTKAWSDGWLPKLRETSADAARTSRSSSHKPCQSISNTSTWSTTFGSLTRVAPCPSPWRCGSP